MRSFAIAVSVAFAAAPLAAQDTAVEAPREVNITQGSTPGWIPGEKLEKEAIATWERFNRLVDSGDFEPAWAMQSDGLRSMSSLKSFVQQRSLSRDETGPVHARDGVKITWTKGAEGLPAPGTYVAIDATNLYQDQTRHCGYTILYLAPDADAFVISRTHDVFVSATNLASIEERSGAMQKELIWRLASSDCPNYAPPPLPAIPDEGIDYPSVKSAFDAIIQREGLERRTDKGWEVIIDEASMTAWSFAPMNDRYYPTVIKRTVEMVSGDNAKMSMSMRCEVEKVLCDALYFEMAAMNGLIEVETQ